MAVPNPAALNFGPEPSVADRQAIITAIDTGTHVVPGGWAAIVMSQAQAMTAIPQVVKDFATNSKRYLIGTTYSDVAAAFYKALAIARQRNNPVQLVKDCILAVYTTYTLSSSWAASYTAFAGASLFASFDIAGRASKAGTKDAWVTASLMNSTAVHLLGYLLVAAAPAGSLLARVRAEKGTPFAVVTTGGEAHEIMKAAAATVTADERAIMAQFTNEAARTLALVSALFGAAGADVNAALVAANRFTGTVV
jgi:hypothetical protein